MKDHLKKVYKLQGKFDITSNDNGFYMVKFDQATDKDNAIFYCRWMISYHYLVVCD